MSFDNYAKNWDTDIRINRAKVIANEIQNVLGYRKNCAAMEFGCGTGLIGFNLIDSFKSITLIDSSKNMIAILNEKIKKYNINNMKAYKLDITSNEKIVGKYDVIYNSMVLHHIWDTESIIKEFYELLNDEGELCIVDLNKEDGKFHKKEIGFEGHNGFSQNKFKDILTNAGFKDIEINTFFYGEKNIDNEKINYSLFIVNAKKI
ncbi:MAG: class I SAM-dependent methyltransferase [Psychrilyobacter sp.]|uniref:class I SAM-dependent DNA methyltransferase n=1 Tax=Psychrilyobacter sp. TaxID=2586924 RepID=UPI003C72EC15